MREQNSAPSASAPTTLSAGLVVLAAGDGTTWRCTQSPNRLSVCVGIRRIWGVIARGNTQRCNDYCAEAVCRLPHLSGLVFTTNAAASQLCRRRPEPRLACASITPSEVPFVPTVCGGSVTEIRVPRAAGEQQASMLFAMSTSLRSRADQCWHLGGTPGPAPLVSCTITTMIST